MSTYSPSLRIELITTGTQAGTWGNTTNTNLGGLIESAIAGYVSVSITSANQALTALNGAPDESRNQTIALTTTTTAAFNVYAPPAEKTYVIYNASSYAATLFNSTILGNTTAAGTGVVIPAGRTVTVWSDGTNFRAQNDHLPTATTAATAAFGTNTTQLATTAFVQAALQALHPVGSVYINATNNTNPATLLGFGTWTAFGAGRVPVGFNAGDSRFDTAEETGGSYDAIIVSHSHTGTTGGQSNDHSHGFSGSTSSAGDHNHLEYNFDSNGSGNGPGPGASCCGGAVVQSGVYTGNAGTHSHSFSGTTGGVNVDHSHAFTTTAVGSSATSANIQPYITVYMWKRTA
jgi:hypothetical protein